MTSFGFRIKNSDFIFRAEISDGYSSSFALLPNLVADMWRDESSIQAE